MPLWARGGQRSELRVCSEVPGQYHPYVMQARSRQVPQVAFIEGDQSGGVDDRVLAEAGDGRGQEDVAASA
jgi:hypothetical protein